MDALRIVRHERATVNTTQCETVFEFAVIVGPNQYGWEFAVTYDPHGLQSNAPHMMISVSPNFYGLLAGL